MTTIPYGLIADVHLHNWSQFATTNEDGVNSRLRIILNEIERAADAVIEAEGDKLVIAGDLFHVRGSVAPSVLNPAFDTFKKIIERGITVYAIPGNHDLEGKESDRVSNAIEALSTLHRFYVANEPNMVVLGSGKAFSQVVLMPWFSSVSKLMETIEEIEREALARESCDLIIHAPVNGVIMGIPDHGLSAGELAKLGFKRVFAGHYHNHVDFGNGVYSIGATTHQTWSDVGSKAGFLLVYPDRVEYRASHAPKFIDITAETKEEELPLIVDGNYCRVKLTDVTESEARTIREGLLEMGALGVVLHVAKTKTVTTRTGATVKTGASLEQSVTEFVKEKKFDNEAAVMKACQDILAEVRAA